MMEEAEESRTVVEVAPPLQLGDNVVEVGMPRRFARMDRSGSKANPNLGSPVFVLHSFFLPFSGHD